MRLRASVPELDRINAKDDDSFDEEETCCCCFSVGVAVGEKDDGDSTSSSGFGECCCWLLPGAVTETQPRGAAAVVVPFDVRAAAVALLAPRFFGPVFVRND